MARHILDARVRDIEKRRLPSKHYVYVIHVSWTDGSITIIYRRYSKFFDFHMKLLATFPDEAGARIPASRTIPFLPGKKVFGRSHTREVALKRMNQLDEYCRVLVKMPGKVSNSEVVITFFSPTPEDINPPSSPEPGRGPSSSEIDEISDPIQAEQYRVIADYKKQQKNEVDLLSGDIVEVFEKNENGWWFVSVQDSQGWAPGTFLAKADGKDDDEEVISGNNEKYITNSPYQADQDDEVSFETGAVVTVVKKSLDGWWLVKYLDKTGWVPATYLQPYKGPDLVHTAPTEVIGNVMSISNLTLTDSPKTGRSNRFQAKDGREKPPRPPPPAGVNKRFNTESKPTPPRRSTVKKSIKNAVQRERKKSEYKTTAPFDGSSSSDDCVSFKAQQTVEVIHKYEEWWFIKVEGREGWAPASYIQTRESPEKGNYTPPAPANISRKGPIDPNRGGSTVSTDSETGAPRGPESPKFHPNGKKPGAFEPYRPQPPVKVNDRRSNGGQVSAPPVPPPPAASNNQRVSSNISDIIQNLQPGPALKTKPKPTAPESKSISQLRSQLEQTLGGNTSVELVRPVPVVGGGGGGDSRKLYRTVASFDDEDGLSFSAGVDVEVIQKDDSGWWNVRIGSEEGWAPSTYLAQVS
ncbi:SH3 and PX domain-containing protein 2A-like isoform X3 [Apostichopus japonicus]|uniref:SH3 and PX domain-containing protein 2A-like isoform X3 n=1 Tax=Stichopus japonicus TaxID=307972 RepID=UPI003AB13F99